MTTLLSLPPELRAMIWEHIFTVPGQKVPIRLSPDTAKHRSILRVLTVCKTIHKEALHLFYSCNDLQLSSTANLFQFLTDVHRKRRLEITSLTVTNFGLHYTGFQMASRAFSMLLLCPNLTSFTLDLTTEFSWDLMHVLPRYAYETHWLEYQGALDCLINLRGLKHASIRGIDPEIWRHSVQFTADQLTEVMSPRAEALKARWKRPPLSRTSQVMGHTAESPAKMPGPIAQSSYERVQVPIKKQSEEETQPSRIPVRRGGNIVTATWMIPTARLFHHLDYFCGTHLGP